MRSVPVPGHVLDCVVKIFATHCEPNYALPWAMTAQKQSVSTGFIISGNRILTNAHAVQHHTVVLLKRRGSDVKYRAKVVAVGNDCDIALLKVPDPRFWKEHHASIAFENGTKATTGNGVVVPDIAHPPFTPEATLDGNIDFPYLTAGGISALNDYCMVVGYPFPGECISVTTGVISRIEMQVSHASQLSFRVPSARMHF